VREHLKTRSTLSTVYETNHGGLTVHLYPKTYSRQDNITIFAYVVLTNFKLHQSLQFPTMQKKNL